MAKLSDCRDQVVGLLSNVDEATQNYRDAANLLAMLDQEDDKLPALNGIGLQLRFASGQSIPVPLPSDPAQLRDLAERSVNFLGEEIARLWHEIHKASASAVQHCQEAKQVQAAQATEAGS